MTQYEFDKILEKYLAGQCTPGEEEIVTKWYERVKLKENETLIEANEENIGIQLWKKIERSTILKKNRRFIYWIRSGSVAAVAILLLWIGWWVIVDQPFNVNVPNKITQNTPTNAEAIEIKNNSTKPQEISLADGSLVVLQPQSALSYYDSFGKTTRTVHLYGDAFFKIKRDITKPFQVFTGKLVTEVLGTSFFIKQQQASGTIEVEVRTGKVSVYENAITGNNKKQTKILTQNQKITFRTDTRQLIPSIVKQPLTVTTLKPKAEPSIELSFEDATLKAVCAQLEKRYLLQIFIEDEAVNHCVFTGDLNGLPLFTQLDLVCKSIGARYEIEDTHIFIKGKGCNNTATQ